MYNQYNIIIIYVYNIYSHYTLYHLYNQFVFSFFFFNISITMGNPLQMEVYSLEAHRSKWGLLQHAMLINSPFPNYLYIYIYMYYHLSLSKFSRLANSLGFSVSPPPFFSGPAPHHARLAGCIFVQNVEAPALAVTIPVLTRGLNDKNEEVKRTCCQPLERVGVVVPGGARWCQVVVLDGFMVHRAGDFGRKKH